MNTKPVTAKAATRIRRPPSEVFAAFADADRMSKFWFHRRDTGLKEGESVTWFVGSEEGAFPFDVHVKEVREPNSLAIEWIGLDGNPALVTWLFEETEEGDTILTIEESGYYWQQHRNRRAGIGLHGRFQSGDYCCEGIGRARHRAERSC